MESVNTLEITDIPVRTLSNDFAGFSICHCECIIDYASRLVRALKWHPVFPWLLSTPGMTFEGWRLYFRMSAWLASTARGNPPSVTTNEEWVMSEIPCIRCVQCGDSTNSYVECRLHCGRAASEGSVVPRAVFILLSLSSMWRGRIMSRFVIYDWHSARQALISRMIFVRFVRTLVSLRIWIPIWQKLFVWQNWSIRYVKLCGDYIFSCWLANHLSLRSTGSSRSLVMVICRGVSSFPTFARKCSICNLTRVSRFGG